MMISYFYTFVRHWERVAIEYKLYIKKPVESNKTISELETIVGDEKNITEEEERFAANR